MVPAVKQRIPVKSAAHPDKISADGGHTARRTETPSLASAVDSPLYLCWFDRVIFVVWRHLHRHDDGDDTNDGGRDQS